MQGNPYSKYWPSSGDWVLSQKYLVLSIITAIKSYDKGLTRMISFKWRHYQKDIILQAVRWYVAYSLSYRDIEELMLERGISVDHSTINRWVIKYSVQLEEEFHKRSKRSVGSSWRMDETYIKVKGEWHYLYRAVDKEGETVDFYLSKNRDKQAAKRFFIKAINRNGLPDKVTIDKSGANLSALNYINQILALLAIFGAPYLQFTIRQIKYLNNIVAVYSSYLLLLD